MDNWTTLLREADRERFRFVAASTRPTDIAEYLDTHRPLAALPVIADPELEDRLVYRLFDTPQTIVIDRQGRVEKIWLGAFGGRRQADAEEYFGVSLPGVDRGPR
jgi:hypothetical protein